MSEINLDEDNYDENESISKSVGSKQRKKRNINTDIGQKIRRSRIIISDNNDTSDNRREFYDPETKYKKNVLSAISFNECLNSSRRKMSKHFLKRKVKVAYEREPIEKAKGFCFNVPFIPNLSMFTPQTQTGVLVGQTVQSVQNKSVSSHNIRDVRDVRVDNYKSSNFDPKAVSINRANEIKSIGIQNEIKSSSIQNVSNQQSRSMFNVNQNVQNVVQVNKSTMNTQEERISIENKPQVNHLYNIQSQSTSSMTFPSNQSSLNQAPYTPEQMESIKAKFIQKQSQTNPSHLNYEMLRQQHIKIKQLVDAYKADPERLKRELPAEEFAKLENLIMKNMNPIKRETGNEVSHMSNNQNSNLTNKPTSQNNFQISNKNTQNYGNIL